MASEGELWRLLGETILKHPELDAPRLDFAAQLDDDENRIAESGTISPRAELIYLQLKLAKMSPDHSEWFRIAIRIRSLLITHQREWTPDLLLSEDILGVEFYRGFAAKITVPAYYLIEMARDLFAVAPIQHLDIVGIKNDKDLYRVVDTLTRVEAIARVRSLGLDSQRIESAETLNIDAWSGLHWLSLRHNRLGLNSVNSLLDSVPESLRSIDLYGNAGDPSQRLVFDQGIVISSELPSGEGLRLRDRRTQKHVVHGFEVHPDRFAVVLEQPGDLGSQ